MTNHDPIPAETGTFLPVTLIVPVYNEGQAFRNCLESLLHLEYPADRLEVIIVDDCSDDGTMEWLTQQKLPDNFNIIRHRENRGRASARNSGLLQAGGDIIIFLDGDMRVGPEFVHAHVEAQSPESVVAVTGKMMPDPQLPRTRLTRYLFESTRRGARQFGEKIPIPFQYLITGNLSIKRKALDAAGRFDENFRGYGGEDTLFAYKIWKKFPAGLRYSEKPVAVDQQNYQLDDLLEKYRQYGSSGLPRLIREFPQMIPALHAHYFVENSPKKVWGDILFHSMFYAIARIKYHIAPYPLSNLFIRYLLLGAVRQGYRSREEETSSI